MFLHSDTRREGRRVTVGDRFVMEYWNFLDGESYAFRQATDLNTTEIVGVRVYLKPHMNPAQLNHELQIRQGLHHRNIIKVIGAFEDEICYYIIVEKAGGMSFSC